MARLTKVQEMVKGGQFRDALKSPEFHRMTRKEQAAFIQVSEQTLYNWFKELTDDDWVEIREELAKKTAKDEIEIDKALTMRAKTGDPKAVELWKELYKGWSRKSINENINRNPELEGLSDEELQLKALRETDPALLAKVLSEKKAPDQIVGEERDEKAAEG